MKFFKSIILAGVSGLLMFLAGCQNGQLRVPGTQPLPGGSVRDLGLMKSSGVPGPYYDALTQVRQGEKQLSREALVGFSVAQSNKLCSDYFATVSATERGLNASLGIFSTMAHMGGILADGTGAKAAWGAYGVAADGVQGAVREDIFRENEATVLMAAIQSFRAEQYEALHKSLTEDDRYEGASFDAVLPLITEYHATCTISNAIIQVQRSVSE